MANVTELGATIVVSFPEGTTDGIWQVDWNPAWNGRLYFCPRARYVASNKIKELGWPGVYILRGQSEDQVESTIYVGEGDPVKNRLDDHYKHKGFWDEAFVCVAGEGKLNKAHIQHLESRLVALAREANHCKLDNGNTPTLPTLSKVEAAQAEYCLGKLLSVLRVLGLTVFEKSEGLPTPSMGSATEPLALRAKGIVASGHIVTSGFVVHKGSQAVSHEVALASDSLKAQRRLLCESKKILVPKGNNLVFLEDYAFKSPSGAASVLLGRSADGRKEWKDDGGRSLKELQEELIEGTGGAGVSDPKEVCSSKLETAATQSKETGQDEAIAYDLDYHYNSTSPEMQKLVNELRGQILQLPAVKEAVGQKTGITYRTTKSFARLEFRKTWIQVLLREARYPEDTKQLVKDITSNGWGYLGMVKFKPDTDVDYLFGLVKGSYRSTL